MFVCFCIFQLQTMADQLLSSRFGTRTSRAVAYAVQTLCKALWAFYDLSSGKKQFCCPLLLEMHLSNPWNNIMLSNKTWIPLWYTVNKDYTFKVTASNRQVTHNIKEIWSSLLPHMIMWIGFKNGTNHLFKNASNSHWLIRPFFVHEKIGLLCFVLFFLDFSISCDLNLLLGNPLFQIGYRGKTYNCDLLLSVFQSASNCVLREDAVPTIFDCTMPVNNQSGCTRKRARDPVSVSFNVKKYSSFSITH